MDTGFSGFLMVPLVHALPFGFVLTGTTSVTLADGQTQVKLTCLGKAELEGRGEIGTIILEPNSAEVLIGIDFLRVFNLRLTVDPILGHIELTPSDLIVPAGTTTGGTSVATDTTAAPPEPQG